MLSQTEFATKMKSNKPSFLCRRGLLYKREILKSFSPGANKCKYIILRLVKLKKFCTRSNVLNQPLSHSIHHLTTLEFPENDKKGLEGRYCCESLL